MLSPSAGLLISMALRSDHSFGIHMGVFDSESSLKAKQLLRIEEVARQYRDGTMSKQVLEEAEGVGFYRGDDTYYFSICADESVVLKAQELAEQLKEQVNERGAHED